MLKSIALGLAAALALAASPAAAAPTCGRACLTGHLTRYLDALTKHRPAALPLTANVRFTEDGRDLKPGDGLWATATSLGTYRQDIIDVRQGVAGTHAVVLEDGKPILLALRLKVKGGKITEIESQVTRTEAESLLLDAKALKRANTPMALPPRGKRNSRAEMVRIADFYPRGLEAGSFVTVDAPFAPEAYRQENGVFTAGAPCTRSPTCKNIKTQPSQPRGAFQTRLLAVDEDEGIAWYRLSWARGQGTRLVVFEAFKVWDDKMQAVEAFMKLAPLASDGGWPSAVAEASR